MGVYSSVGKMFSSEARSTEYLAKNTRNARKLMRRAVKSTSRGVYNMVPHDAAVMLRQEQIGKRVIGGGLAGGAAMFAGRRDKISSYNPPRIQTPKGSGRFS